MIAQLNSKTYLRKNWSNIVKVDDYTEEKSTRFILKSCITLVVSYLILTIIALVTDFEFGVKSNIALISVFLCYLCYMLNNLLSSKYVRLLKNESPFIHLTVDHKTRTYWLTDIDGDLVKIKDIITQHKNNSHDVKCTGRICCCNLTSLEEVAYEIVVDIAILNSCRYTDISVYKEAELIFNQPVQLNIYQNQLHDEIDEEIELNAEIDREPELI